MVFDNGSGSSEPRKQLLVEIGALRRRVRDLEASQSQLERADRALAESEKRYRDLYENAPIAYHSTGADGRILDANRRAVELFGYPREELVGRAVFDLYADTPSGMAKVRTLFEHFRAGEEILDEEMEMRRADGTTVWAQLSVRPILDDAGHVVASRSMVVDVTLRKRAEAERQRLEQELFQAQKVESIGRLAGGMAHDFNNLLVPIIGFTELALRSLDPQAPLHEDLAQVRNAAERAKDLAPAASGLLPQAGPADISARSQ